MANVTIIAEYDGVQGRAERLGLSSALKDISVVLEAIDFRLEEKNNGNGAAAVTAMVDNAFEARGWEQGPRSGGIDWFVSRVVNGTTLRIGIEVQISGRSNALATDMIHLIGSFDSGGIDLAVVVVPSDETSRYLTERVASAREAKQQLDRLWPRALPLLLIGIGHNGTGPPLPKKQKGSTGFHPFTAMEGGSLTRFRLGTCG